MSWKNKRNGMPSGLAAELLRSLFSGDGGPRHQPRPQWKCPGCHTQNYMNRSTCRYCGANTATTPTTPPTKKNQSPVNAKPLALAPWATPEMVKQREEQLTIAISAAKASGGCAQAVTKLEAELTGQQKKAAAPTSVLTQIESTKGFIGRATKRQEALDERIAELQAERAQVHQEVAEAEARLSRLEAEAAKQLNVQPKLAENTSSGLEDAVRMLLVAMHACQTLPPNLAEACAAVSTCLPQPSVSEDVHEMSMDGGASLREEEVPAGQLDVALPSSDAMAELDLVDDEDEVALVEMARRLKRARRATPY